MLARVGLIFILGCVICSSADEVKSGGIDITVNSSDSETKPGGIGVNITQHESRSASKVRIVHFFMIRNFFAKLAAVKKQTF